MCCTSPPPNSTVATQPGTEKKIREVGILSIGHSTQPQARARLFSDIIICKEVVGGIQLDGKRVP